MWSPASGNFWLLTEAEEIPSLEEHTPSLDSDISKH